MFTYVLKVFQFDCISVSTYSLYQKAAISISDKLIKKKSFGEKESLYILRTIFNFSGKTIDSIVFQIDTT